MKGGLLVKLYLRLTHKACYGTKDACMLHVMQLQAGRFQYQQRDEQLLSVTMRMG